MLKYKWLLLSVVLVISSVFALQWVKRVGFIPIEVVTLTDKLQYADPAVIKTVVTPHIKDGFFALRIGVIRSELKTIPWIANANVQRCWPNTVKIKIFEKQPLATWQGKGVIDTEGNLFFPSSIANLEELPIFIGAQEQVDAMVDTYLMLLAALKPIGLAVKGLEIMPDQGWRAMLDNGVTVVLGQTELEERLARFILAYSKVAETEQFNVVDLRYTNGLTIAYRPGGAFEKSR